jgi:hypothetical protein
MLARNDRERYVLVSTLADGTPNAVRPVSNAKDGKRILHELRQAGEAQWHLFDILEKRRVAVSGLPPLSPPCPMFTNGHPASFGGPSSR